MSEPQAVAQNHPSASFRVRPSPSPGTGDLSHSLQAFEPLPPLSSDIVELADEHENRFRIRVVDDSIRRARASSLLERRYAWRGYSAVAIEPRPDCRVTLAACAEEATVATITAGLDGDDGLYVGSLFGNEVQALRDEGRKLCEFTKLAVDESVRSHAVLGAIFHVACMYVLDLHGSTDVLIEVNPRHVRFYERMLGFKQLAGERIDPQVNAPAVLLRLDLDHCASEIARLGGRRSMGMGERSFYPFFLPPEQAAEVVTRLRVH